MAKIGNLFNHNRVNLGDAIPLSTPFVIQLETSGYCNLKCRFCPSGDDRSGIKRDIMTVEDFRLFISQCKEFPENIKILRIIGIGEPLLNKNIILFVKEAKNSGIFNKIEITTNGVLLTHEMSDGLIEAGLDTLLVSLEATNEDKFQEIARVKVDLDKLYENLKYFYEHRGKCILYIKSVDAALESETEKEEFYSKYGMICDEIQIEHIIENWPEFSSSSSGESVRYDIEAYSGSKDICIQPFKLLCISANGDVVPCCVDWKRSLILGNIKNTPLIDIWNGNKLKALRLLLLKGKMCEYCAACSYRRSNQPDNIDDYAEEIIARLEREN